MVKKTPQDPCSGKQSAGQGKHKALWVKVWRRSMVENPVSEHECCKGLSKYSNISVIQVSFAVGREKDKVTCEIITANITK
jgi:hypothetical protein